MLASGWMVQVRYCGMVTMVLRPDAVFLRIYVVWWQQTPTKSESER